MDDVKSVFDYTQRYFLMNGFNKDNNTGITRYIHFVAAHASMADQACEDTKQYLKTLHYGNQEAVHKAYNLHNKKHGYWMVYGLFELGRYYVKALHDDRQWIKTYLKSKNIAMCDEKIEAAWWVLQLRGIAWHFSTWNTPAVVKEVIGEQLVPSLYYGNKGPVWIT